MKLKELKEMETKRLHELLAETREKVRELRFGLVNRQVKNIREIRSLKKRIAMVLTVLNTRRGSAHADTKEATK